MVQGVPADPRSVLLTLVIMPRHLIFGIATVVLLGACSTESSPTPVPSDGEYLAYVERIELVVACVQGRGFEASSTTGFSVRVGAAGEDQLRLAEQAEGECWEEVEHRFPAPPPLSLEEQYPYMLDVAECLRDLGHAIPDAPSLDTYLDQIAGDTAPTDFWDPYFMLAQRGVDIWAIQRESCPPYPWMR